MKAALLLALALAVVQAPQEPPPKPKPPVSAPPPQTDPLAVCVASCRRTYFFCLQQNEEDICSPAWATCRAGCVRANPLPGAL